MIIQVKNQDRWNVRFILPVVQSLMRLFRVEFIVNYEQGETTWTDKRIDPETEKLIEEDIKHQQNGTRPKYRTFEEVFDGRI